MKKNKYKFKITIMTEKKLHERLLHYKSKYGLTKETFQHYQWALELLKQQPEIKSKNLEEGV